MARLGSCIEPFLEGIYVRPADAWVDPSEPKGKALVTYGHADHARGGYAVDEEATAARSESRGSRVESRKTPPHRARAA